MIWIIADDLTGACDTGVQFRNVGLKPVVYIVDGETLPADYTAGSDISVFDTETREAGEKKARRRVGALLSRVSPGREDLLYKKIDSTMRGNVGAEIEEILEKTGRDLCLLTPAFPSTGRITAGGYLLVDGIPLGETEYMSGGNPARDSHLPTCIQSQTELPVGGIELREVMRGAEFVCRRIEKLYGEGYRILCIDAVHEGHFQSLVQGSLKFEGNILYAGSGGLARILASETACGQSPGVEAEKTEEMEQVLVVVGSRRTIVKRQVEYLLQKRELLPLRVDPGLILDGGEDYLDETMARALVLKKRQRHLLIEPVSKGQDLQKSVPPREEELFVRGFLGELTWRILSQTGINRLVATGGDTALGICSALGVSSLQIEGELLTGIPLVRGRSHDLCELIMATKAGGFGNEDTLHKLVKEVGRFRF